MADEDGLLRFDNDDALLALSIYYPSVLNTGKAGQGCKPPSSHIDFGHLP